MAKSGWCCVSHLRKQALFASKFALSHGAYDCKLVIYRKRVSRRSESRNDVDD